MVAKHSGHRKGLDAVSFKIPIKSKGGPVMGRITGKSTEYGERARAFYDAALADYVLTDSELLLLAQVCKSLDVIDGLNAAIARDGLTVEGASGQVRVHPAVAEVRSTGLAVARLLAQLGLPDEAGAKLPTALSLRSQRGNQTRWAVSAADREKFRNG
jgi:hypothetical protein